VRQNGLESFTLHLANPHWLKSTVSKQNRKTRTAVVIPCYKVANSLPDVVSRMPDEVDLIYCVDDACPQDSTRSIEAMAETDNRIRIIRREQNGGVGAAVMTGYRQAIEDGIEVVVKVDGDGQMDPALIPLFVKEIAEGRADYTKGNRFHSLDMARSMPMVRKIGNMGLSFMSKLSTGYWQLFDPTNGYTAIHTNVLRALRLERIEERYFFESDLLYHLGLVRARVLEVPMQAVYGDEESNLSNLAALRSFPVKHGRNFFKRIANDYFLRNFSLASLELLVGGLLVLFSLVFGIQAWAESAQTGEPATAGTVMLASLPFLVGIQFLLNFFAYDMAREPRQAIFPRLEQDLSEN
jgi:glycosyltransferase involved in cell wall biosynthesis